MLDNYDEARMKQTLFRMGPAVVGRLPKPIILPNLKILVSIALLGSATQSWAQGGNVIAWGDNGIGQTAVPSGLSDVVAIAAGEWHTLVLKADGTVVAWGANNSGQGNVPSDLGDVRVIAACGFHNMALKSDGTVRAWGWNDSGQCNVPAGLSNVVDIAGGWSHSLALKADGTVVAWGRNNEGQATVPDGLNNVVAISSGEYHNLALKSDGTVVAWGWNGVGQTTVPAGLSNVVAIVGCGLHSLALKSDGTVTAWGFNELGQADVPAGLSNVVAIAGGVEHSLALKSDGTVVGWGSNEAWANSDCQFIGHPGCERKPAGQIDIPNGLNNVVAIAAGNFHSLALRADAAPAASVRLSGPKRVGNTFNCSANTENGRVYVLEYKDSLSATSWTSSSLVLGTNTEREFIDSSAGTAERFYRVRRW